MRRLLAMCITCERMFVVNVSGHQAVESYEEIPDDLQEEAKRLKQMRPHSQLMSFGGCTYCKRPGWPTVMIKIDFRGIPN